METPQEIPQYTHFLRKIKILTHNTMVVSKVCCYLLLLSQFSIYFNICTWILAWNPDKRRLLCEKKDFNMMHINNRLKRTFISQFCRLPKRSCILFFFQIEYINRIFFIIRKLDIYIRFLGTVF